MTAKDGQASNGTPAPILAFPYYYGPNLRSFGSALLWFGRLDCIMLPWISKSPERVFESMTLRACERAHPLADLLCRVRNTFIQSLETAVGESQELGGLGDKVKRIIAVGPGGPDHYRSIEGNRPAIDIAVGMLSRPALSRVACCQFIWRCYEYYSETGKSFDTVLEALLGKVKAPDGESRLLAECLVNHYRSFAQSPGAIVTDDHSTIELLATLAETTLAGTDQSELSTPVSFSRDHLANMIFEYSVSSWCPPLSKETCGRYRKSLDEKSDAIEGARRRCYLAADALLDKQHDHESFKTLWRETLSSMESEVREIAEIDSNAWRSFVGRLLEDRAVWIAVSGFVGGLTGALPPVTLAAALVTILASLGTKGISEARNHAKTLSESQWCFIYELRSG